MSTHLIWAHTGIAHTVFLFKALILNLTGSVNTVFDLLGGFCLCPSAQFLKVNGRNFYNDVNSI
jgi:hypothetical protein